MDRRVVLVRALEALQEKKVNSAELMAGVKRLGDEERRLQARLSDIIAQIHGTNAKVLPLMAFNGDSASAQEKPGAAEESNEAEDRAR